MLRLVRPLLTPRLRLEPVTPSVTAAAREGEAALERVLGAAIPSSWRGAGMALTQRGPSGSLGAEATPVRAIIVLQEPSLAIGDIRFEPLALAPWVVEIGYGIATPFRRQGYANEAARAVTDWLRAPEHEVREIIAGCNPRNRASIGVLRKLGFILDRCEPGAFWWTLDPAAPR